MQRNRMYIAYRATKTWNKSNKWVIYSASSPSLAALELLMHQSGIQLDSNYKLLQIEASVQPEDIEVILTGTLPHHWRFVFSYPYLQEIGSTWYKKQKQLLLRVPSAVLPIEENFVINTRHPDFSTKVQIAGVLDFD